MITERVLDRMLTARGPRYLVYATVRAGEYLAEYRDTAAQAEDLRRRWDEDHYREVAVAPPEGTGDLVGYAVARRSAITAYNEATALLRAACLRALESGRYEAEVARSAGVDRMTVRAWAGKTPKN